MNFQPDPTILRTMKVLITGGAGYVGSHIAHLLTSQNYDVTVIDDLSSGHRQSLPSHAELVEADFANPKALQEIFKDKGIDCVLHCAAFVDVADSVHNPLKYFENNFHKTQQLLQSMLENNVQKLIFSSTASVYKASKNPVKETDDTAPKSPYGQSKLMCEWLIQSLSQCHPELRYVIFRYFNVAGAEPDQSNGQNNPEATHLIKRGVQAVLGEIDDFAIMGSDYDTADGTCIRDFIHVKDLATAHLSALEYLKQGKGSEILNCGYMKGYSVKEVVDTLQKLADKPFPVHMGPRRPGDLVQVVANNHKILQTLNWKPQFDDLTEICRSSLNWEKSLKANDALRD